MNLGLSEAHIEQARLAQCNVCLRNRMAVCLECGCLIVLKVKLAGAACPLGRW